MDVSLQKYVRDLKINRLLDDVSDEEISISIRDLYFNILDDVDIKMSPGDTRIYFMIEYNYYMEYDILHNTMTCMYRCSARALSTSKGPMRKSEDLITSSERPTNHQ